jgi:cytochrome P450
MGIANGSGSELVRATNAFMSLLDRPQDERPFNESLGSLAAALQALEDVIAASARPGDNSLVSAFSNQNGSDEGLSREEIAANIMLIFAAGHGTTTSLISGSVLALLEEPRQLRLLEERPELIASAIEEVLRLESPIQSVSRTAKSATWIGDSKVEAGQGVVLLIGSANRDEREFASPERLDLLRRPIRHLAFGRGAHLCVGAAIARLQARVAVPMLLQELHGAQVAKNGVAWQQTPNTRGLSRLILDRASPSILGTA